MKQQSLNFETPNEIRVISNKTEYQNMLHGQIRFRLLIIGSPAHKYVLI